MAAATLVASAVGILILIVTAYVVMGGTIALSETVTTSQKALAEQEAARLHTTLEITGASVVDPLKVTFLEVKNIGSEPVRSPDEIGIILLQSGEPVYYTNSSGTWWYLISPDAIHPGQLDPDEVMNISVTYTGVAPTWAKVVTGNGIYDSIYL
jgi:archaeal flagellar protein FlaF